MPWTAARVGISGDPDALRAGLFGGGGRGVAQVGVVRQQHHLARVGAADGLDEFAAGGRLPGAGEHGGRAGLGVQPGQPLAGHHGHDGPLAAPRRRSPRRRAPRRRRSG